MSKKLLLTLSAFIILSGCGHTAHSCAVKAINTCGKNNVLYANVGIGIFTISPCWFRCDDYIAFITSQSNEYYD